MTNDQVSNYDRPMVWDIPTTFSPAAQREMRDKEIIHQYEARFKELCRLHREALNSGDPWRAICGHAEQNPLAHLTGASKWFIENKEVHPMKTLYQVIVVHNDKVAIDTKVVAKDVEDARFKSGTYGWLINEGLTPGDVTIIVNALGKVEEK